MAFRICATVRKWPVWPMPRVRAARAIGSSASTARARLRNGCSVRAAGNVAVRRPRANSDARHRLRTRVGDPEFQTARLLARHREIRNRAGRIRRHLISVPISKGTATSTIGSTAFGTRRWRKRLSPRARASRSATVSEEKKASSQIAPRLYDLTTLQREANGRLRFFGQAHVTNCAGALREDTKC